MKRRFRVYGFGFLLGIIMAWALFLRGRNTKPYTAWTPNNRVLEEIRLDTQLDLDASFWCKITCLGFNSLDYDHLINDGNVAFDESEIEKDKKRYRVKLKVEDKGVLVVDYLFEESHRSVVNVFKEGEDIKCDC